MIVFKVIIANAFFMTIYDDVTYLIMKTKTSYCEYFLIVQSNNGRCIVVTIYDDVTYLIMKTKNHDVNIFFIFQSNNS